MLCQSCRVFIAKRLGPDDYLILDTLQRKRAVSGASGLSREDLLAMCETPLTIARLANVLTRLTVTGLADHVTISRRDLFYITPDGEAVLVDFKTEMGRR